MNTLDYCKQEFRKFAMQGQGENELLLDQYMHHVESNVHLHRNDNMTRSVKEERHTHFREIDVFSRLMMERIFSPVPR